MNFKKKIVHMALLFVLLFAVSLSGTSTIRAEAKTAKANTWVKKSGKFRYLNSNGSYVKKKFKKIGGYWFYFNKNGYAATGLTTIGGRKFYFKKTGTAGKKGRMLTGWRTVGGKKYYFRKSGGTGVKGAAYKSEWVTIGGQRYYFNADGSLNTNTMTEQEFIDTIGNLAREDMKQSGILASVTTAQAILESGYGTTSLGMEANNLFGMKAVLSNNSWASAWKGQTFIKTTQEYLNEQWYTITDTFRAYDSYAESLADHSAYLSGAMNGKKLRYAGVVGNTSYKKTIRIIKNGGYATDPAYVTKICNIIKKYKLTRFDK